MAQDRWSSRRRRRRGRVRAWRLALVGRVGRGSRVSRCCSSGSAVGDGRRRARDRRRVARCCGSGSCGTIVGVLLDARAPPEPRMTAGARPATATAATPDAEALGRPGRGEPARARTSSCRRGRRSRRSTAGRPRRLLDRATPASAPRSCCGGPGPLPWAFAYAPRGPVLRALGRGVDRGVHRARPRPASATGAGRVEPPAHRPRDRARGGPRRGRRGDRRAARPRAGGRARAIQPVGDPGHRPRGRRGGAVGRPAQEVAPVREQGADGRRARSSTRARSGSTTSTGSTARRPTGPGS